MKNLFILDNNKNKSIHNKMFTFLMYHILSSLATKKCIPNAFCRIFWQKVIKMPFCLAFFSQRYPEL